MTSTTRYNNDKADMNSGLSSVTTWSDDQGGFRWIYVWKAEVSKRNAPAKVMIKGMPFIRVSTLMSGLFVGDQVRAHKEMVLGTVVGCKNGLVEVFLSGNLSLGLYSLDAQAIKEVNGVRVESDEVVDNMIKYIGK